MIKKLLSIVFLVGMTVAAVAQGQITGVLKTTDGQPVMFANIVLLRASDSSMVRGTVADDKGHFSLKNDTATALLRVSAIGFARRFIPVPQTTTKAGKVDMGTIEMKAGATMLDMVKVVSESPSMP